LWAGRETDAKRPAAYRAGMNTIASLDAPAARNGRPLYLTVLGWAVTLLGAVRLLSYLPTLWAICSSGQSGQHALTTWLTWAAANATMAAWLYEQHGRRVDCAVLINGCNAAMCLLTSVVITAFRF